MLNRTLNKVNSITRIAITLIVILMILISKSLYLIMFLSTLILILLLSSNLKFKQYINKVNFYKVPILVLFILYILIFKLFKIKLIIILLLKFILITVLLSIMTLSVSFEDIYSVIYTLTYPLKKLKINNKKISSNILLGIYYIKYLFNIKEQIKNVSNNFYVKKYNYGQKLISRLFLANNKVKEIEETLILTNYKTKKIKQDYTSNTTLIIFIILFVICLIKEVIL